MIATVLWHAIIAVKTGAQPSARARTCFLQVDGGSENINKSATFPLPPSSPSLSLSCLHSFFLKSCFLLSLFVALFLSSFSFLPFLPSFVAPASFLPSFFLARCLLLSICAFGSRIVRLCAQDYHGSVRGAGPARLLRSSVREQNARWPHAHQCRSVFPVRLRALFVANSGCPCQTDPWQAQRDSGQQWS